MKLKRLFILTLLIAGVATHAYAQFGVPNLVKYDKRRFHFGFTLGYNLFDYRITSKPDLAEYDSLMLTHSASISTCVSSPVSPSATATSITPYAMPTAPRS